MKTFKIFIAGAALGRYFSEVTGNSAHTRNSRYIRGRACGPTIICAIHSLCPRVQTVYLPPKIVIRECFM